MAISAYSNASPTVGATEYSFAAASTTLPTKTDKGVYALVLDTNAIVAGDSFLIQLYEAGKPSGGTKRVVEAWTLEGPQGKPMVILPSLGAGFIVGNGWDLTIKKLAGTDRAMDFTVWQIA